MTLWTLTAARLVVLASCLRVACGVTVVNSLIDSDAARLTGEWARVAHPDAIQGTFLQPGTVAPPPPSPPSPSGTQSSASTAGSSDATEQEGLAAFQHRHASACTNVAMFNVAVRLPPLKATTSTAATTTTTVTVVTSRGTSLIDAQPDADAFVWHSLGTHNLCTLAGGSTFAEVRVHAGAVDAVRITERHPVEPIPNSCVAALPGYSAWEDLMLPTSGDVKVPEGMQVLYNTSLSLDSLIISGSVVFADDHDLALDTRLLVITKTGSLKVGWDGCPRLNAAAVTLHGELARSGTVETKYDVKRIVVEDGGSLEMVAQPDSSGEWMRLAQTLHAGSDLLEVPLPLPLGAEVVVASTDGPGTEHHSETFVIVSEGAQSLTYELDRPAVFTHLAESTDRGAEVGLLSRRVAVRGADSNVQHPFYLTATSTTDVHHPAADSNAAATTVSAAAHIDIQAGATLSLEHVELAFMGGTIASSVKTSTATTPALGLKGSGERFMHRCSVHHCFAGCLELGLAQQGAIVQDNVVFEALGAAIALTGAKAVRNSVLGNLIVNARDAAAGSLEDTQGASDDNDAGDVLSIGTVSSSSSVGFYSNSAANTFKYNVVVGSAVGGCLDLGSQPDDGAFVSYDDTFHGCETGLWVDYAPDTQVTLKLIDAYRNSVGVRLSGSNLVLDAATLISNTIGVLLQGERPWGMMDTSGVSVRNSLLAGNHTVFGADADASLVGGVEFQGSLTHEVDACQFEHFVSSPTKNAGAVVFTSLVASVGNVVTASTLTSVSHALYVGPYGAGLMHDADGTLRASAVGRVLLGDSTGFLKLDTLTQQCQTAVPAAMDSSYGWDCDISVAQQYAMMLVGSSVLPAKVTRASSGVSLVIVSRFMLVAPNDTYIFTHGEPNVLVDTDAADSGDQAAASKASAFPVIGAANMQPADWVRLVRPLGEVGTVLKVSKLGSSVSDAIPPLSSQEELSTTSHSLASFYDASDDSLYQQLKNADGQTDTALMQEHAFDQLEATCPDGDDDGLLDGDGVCDLGEGATTGCYPDCPDVFSTSTGSVGTRLVLFFNSELGKVIGEPGSDEADQFLKAVRKTVTSAANLTAGSIIDSSLKKTSDGSVEVVLVFRTANERSDVSSKVNDGDVDVEFDGKTYPATATPNKRKTGNNPAAIIAGAIAGVIILAVVVYMIVDRKRKERDDDLQHDVDEQQAYDAELLTDLSQLEAQFPLHLAAADQASGNCLQPMDLTSDLLLSDVAFPAGFCGSGPGLEKGGYVPSAAAAAAASPPGVCVQSPSASTAATSPMALQSVGSPSARHLDMLSPAAQSFGVASPGSLSSPYSLTGEEPFYDHASPATVASAPSPVNPLVPPRCEAKHLQAMAVGDLQALEAWLDVTLGTDLLVPADQSPASTLASGTHLTLAETAFLRSPSQGSTGSPSTYLLISPESPNTSRRSTMSSRKSGGVDLVDAQGLPLTTWAAVFGSTASLRCLLKRGVSPNTPSASKGQTTLHEVCLANLPASLASILLDHGANPNVSDFDGATPLMHASRQGAAPVIEVLLKSGAQLSCQDNRGMTALMLSAAFLHDETLKQLVDACGNTDQLNQRDHTEWTALHWAGAVGSAKCLAVLLRQSKTNISLQNKKGETALHLAARDGSCEAVKTLLSNHGDRSEREILHMLMQETNDGQSAVEYAKRADQHDSAAAIAKRQGELSSQYAQGSTTTALSPPSVCSPESATTDSGVESESTKAPSPPQQAAEEMRKEKQKQQSRRKRQRAKANEAGLNAKVDELSAEHEKLQAMVTALRLEAERLRAETVTF
eukprot:m.481944 g.481944  ORF g.481944 m.481944 type:complete len:1803 (+) comp22393_c0_seq1:395-5803(+)